MGEPQIKGWQAPKCALYVDYHSSRHALLIFIQEARKGAARHLHLRGYCRCKQRRRRARGVKRADSNLLRRHKTGYVPRFYGNRAGWDMHVARAFEPPPGVTTDALVRCLLSAPGSGPARPAGPKKRGLARPSSHQWARFKTCLLASSEKKKKRSPPKYQAKAA